MNTPFFSRSFSLSAIFFGSALGFGCGAAEDEGDSGDDIACAGAKCDDLDAEDRFEFVIVGSGAGGGPLAANLARNGHSVLLLEAGQDVGDKIVYQVPAYHGKSTEDPDMRWDYFVRHYGDDERPLRDSKLVFDEETGDPKGILYPRAGTLGGCTAHNAMITIEAHESDWDRIAQATGDASWSAAAMDPYFDRVMRWLGTETADPKVALFDLQLQQAVSGAVLAFVDATGQGPFSQLLVNVTELTGLLTRDLNEIGPGTEGVYPFPLAMRDGRRRGTREYLLETVDAGFPLTIQTGAFVTELVYSAEPAADGTPQVVGVEFVRADHLYGADPNTPRDPAAEPLPATQVAVAEREVIVAAGAFNTPQILKLSGIGPREELQEHGIDVVVDLPGVGENLQDRYEVGLVSAARREFGTLKPCTFGEDPATDPCLEDWENGEGPYGSNGGVTTIIKRSSRDLPDPDLFIFGVPGKFAGYEPGYSVEATADKHLFTWLILKGHTKNRAGTVKLRSADPRVPPEIDFHYFDDGTTAVGEDEHDLQAMVEGVNFVRQIERKTRRLMGAPLFGDFEEVWPGTEVDTREEIAQWVKDEAWGHHASCTAKIGGDTDAMAVLDSRFRVRGVSGLRVVDASVFPEIPGFFIVTPIYMVSEKATDVILEDMGETRIEANQP
jgi:choline dehydrogenase